MPTNDYLPFCPTDTGTNLESQATYLAGTDRNTGNQPGIASLQLNNKALRQGTFIAAELAQMVSDLTGTDTLDNGVQSQFLSQLKATLQPLPRTYTSYLSGIGTHNPTYYFFIASGNATTGATYTNNSITYTVVTTISSGTLLRATGGGAPLVAGTLTKASGTGDATITFYAVRSPISMNIEMAGGGGGGSGSGTADGSSSSNGGDTTFSTRTAGGGVGASNRSTQGSGGTTSGSGFTVLRSFAGGSGEPGQFGPTTANGSQASGGSGGTSFFSGAGRSGVGGQGGTAVVNSGGGGGGGGNDSSVSGEITGSGGGAGAYLNFSVSAPLTNYAYAVGIAGTAGGAGTSGRAGGAGAVGQILVSESYQ